MATPTEWSGFDSMVIVVSSCARYLVAPAGWAERPRRLLHGFHDVLIAGAPAQVAGEALRGYRPRSDSADVSAARVRRQQHPGCAEAALQAVLIPEALLQRVQRAAWCQPLDGEDLVAVGLRREHRARLHRPDAVHDDNAAAAARGVAADVGTRQSAFFPEE